MPLGPMRASIATSFALLIVTACNTQPAPKREWTPADHGQPAAPDDDVMPEANALAPGEDVEARAARALWNASCAGCHGRDGRGFGEARPPGAQLPDFTSAQWQADANDDALAQVIIDGRNMMPAFGKQINPQGVAALVRHIRRLGSPPAAEGAAPEGGGPAQAPVPAQGASH
jgi:mono/diheme cytochrome c family protein